MPRVGGSRTGGWLALIARREDIDVGLAKAPMARDLEGDRGG
jgi:hypothetical protein